MQPSITTLHGESFFRDDVLLYINRADEDYKVPMHNHDFLEIAYVAEGVGFHHIGGDVLKAQKGDLYVIPIGMPHVFRPTAGDVAKHPIAVYNCTVSTRLLDRIVPLLSDRSLAAFVSSLYCDEPRLLSLPGAGEHAEKLFYSLHREYMQLREGYADYLHTLLIQLLITVFRLTESRLNPSGTTRATPFFELLQYLDRHTGEELTLSDLAVRFTYSERQLQRLFKQHTGQTFVRYRQGRRIEKSCEWLRNPELKISAVAEYVGYKDRDTFVAVFKRYMGITPSQFRNRWRNSRSEG